MCIVCVHYEAEKLTAFEAIRNIGEMVGSPDVSEEHAHEVMGRILNDEMDNIIGDLDIKLDGIFI
jgi:hypothetical protein